MAKKVIYLGNNKWCYTENCSQHAQLISASKELTEALHNQDHKKAALLSAELKTTKEGLAVHSHTTTQYLKSQLGRKPILGLDLDGTTADFTAGMRWHMATKDGIKIPKDEWLAKFPDPSEYDYHQGDNAWFADREEFLTNFFAAEKRGIYRNLPIYDNASDTLKELKNYGFNIKVVTARNATFNNHTGEWLKKHILPYSVIKNPGHAKEEVLADVYMDDAPVVIKRLIEKEKKVLIMSREYNRTQVDDKHVNARRLENWEDKVVENIFDLLLPNQKNK